VIRTMAGVTGHCPTSLRCVSRVLVALVAVITASLPTSLHLSPAAVADGAGLKVWPVKTEKALNGGDAFRETLTVQNLNGEPLLLRLYTMDFDVDSQGGYSFLEPGHESYSCARWLGLAETEFELGPGEKREVGVEISVPEVVECGDHYGAVLCEACSVDGEEVGGVGVTARVASVFYITVPGMGPGSVVACAEISQLRLPGWVENGPVDVAVVLSNTGDVHVDVAAEIAFQDFRGRVFSTVDLGQTTILPGNERVLQTTLETTPFVGSVTARAVIGYYDHERELVNKERSVRFIVVPVKIAVGAFVGILIVTWLLLRLKKKYHVSIQRRG